MPVTKYMNTILNFLSVHMSGVIGAVLASVIPLVITALWHRHRDRRDSEAIYTFMKEPGLDGLYKFRTTHAIASHTKLTSERVETLCSRHPKIRRNQLEKQSWTLSD